uniref:Uncharacterized protein n=1 Tax=Panagrolaimus superbus TaxID=310955 RepID=A0A914XZE6_9BILA
MSFIIKTAKFLDESVLSKKDKNTTFARRFIKWAERCDNGIKECCLNATNILPDYCILNYTKETLEYFKPTKNRIFNKIEESAIFEKDTYKFMGFIIQGPSNFPYSYTYHDLKEYFTQLDYTQSHIPHPPSVPMLLGLPQTTNLFDLLSSLLYGTTVSVGISLGISAIVIVASTSRPLLSLAAILSITFSISVITASLLIFGWTINVIEATILVITIGLCFDYSLHLAVAYKLSSDIVVTQKIR